MKTLYIHIGTPKTGTTAIQAFCQENQEILQKNGYSYPFFPYSYEEAIPRRNGHFLVGYQKGKDGKRDRALEKQIFCGGMEIIRNLLEQYDNVILSDEGIWTMTCNKRKSLWRELAEEADKHGFTVKIIVYLRSQDSYLCSSWNQTVKVGAINACTETWEEYLADVPKLKQPDYAEKLDTIAAEIGRENIIVRRFEKESFAGGSIYGDFLDAVGLKLDDGYVIGQEFRNGGLSGNTHELKRILNTLHLDKEQNEIFRDILLTFAGESARAYRSSVISEEQSRQIMERYEEGNRHIAEEYLHEPDGTLFHARQIREEKWKKDNPYLVDDIIRFTGAGMLYLMEENRKLKQEQDELKQEVEMLKKFRKKVKNPLYAVCEKIRKH